MKFLKGPSTVRAFSPIIVVGLLALTIVVRNLEWYQSTSEPPEFDPFTPLSINRLKNFNGIDPGFSQKISQLDGPVVIFVPVRGGWHTYGHVFHLLDPNLEKSKVWPVLDLGNEKNAEIISKASGRKLYKGDPLSGSITPYENDL